MDRLTLADIRDRLRDIGGGFAALVIACCGVNGYAAQQSAGGATQAGQSAQSARAAAPLDLTGYWVSYVTEDWRWRMVTPPKGDFESVPLNAAGRRVGNAWDPDKDEASGQQCRAYGAAGLMRIPMRFHITWENDKTLKLETDAGEQVRRFQFGDKQSVTPGIRTPRRWQGLSLAEWEAESPLRYQVGGIAGGGAAASPLKLGLTGSLRVVTTNMRAGYLRKNGVPYSENAVLTEYFDKTAPEPNGDVWLTVTSVVEDPQYLLQPFITTSHFKQERDSSKWRPRPCQIIRPLK